MQRTNRTTRPRTGDANLDQLVDQLVEQINPTEDREITHDILATAVRLAGDGADRLNLKITRAALREIRAAFRAFAPYRELPKITIFGSARVAHGDPLYRQAGDLARRMASQGWMVVTGAGPGIMAAGLEGAGREKAFGVTIRLPFEQTANEFIAGDDKLVSMKYFFTRKLMLMKESRGFVSLPGGFGTLDETFELLTLQQTGKAEPAPVVLLDRPGGTYWSGFERFIAHGVAGHGYIDDYDRDLYLVTDDVDAACAEVMGFYRNYHSLRWVGDRLVLRLEAAPTDDELAQLNESFPDLCVEGTIERTDPLSPEVADGDRLDKARVVLQFNFFRYGRLRALIGALNRLESAPAVGSLPPA